MPEAEVAKSVYVNQRGAGQAKFSVPLHHPQHGIDAGLLLHPAVGYMLNEYVVTQGHKIHFATVDMAVDAKTIKRQLLELAHDCAGVAADGLPLHKAVAAI
ncbi:hypothetical protein [Citrobacter enshiensis]|uniref:hypothetical protein n=1 Tax=Citrobacter enshiensis TaxID=2971264 RepID=UPI00399D69C9